MERFSLVTDMITLTLTQVGVALYGVIALMVISAGALHESSFVNPSYGFVLLSGALWPLIVINLVVGSVTGFYPVGYLFDKYW